ncbi:MAG: cyanophycin synthetase [Bacteroidota bacterium]
MKILDIKTMRGPNYWSSYWHNLIVVKIDIKKLENFPTNKINGFPQRLEALMPSLFSHRCSEKHEGGFFERVREGTWMAHVIEHITLELQWLAGMECGFGRTRSADEKGVYYIAFSYEIVDAGYYAIDAAIRIAEHLVANQPYDISADIQELKTIKSRRALGVSTQAIIEEARNRSIPVRRMNRDSLIVLGQGKRQKRIQASMTCSTSALGVDTACDKEETKRLLERAYIPVPAGRVVSTEEELIPALKALSFPLVIKPIDGNQGKGITTNIKNKEQALAALATALTFSKDAIVEQFISGTDYRLLVVNYKLVSAAQRTPAMVIGDGFSAIKDLIEQANNDPRRGDGHEKVLTKIKVDHVTAGILAERGFTLDTVLPIGEILFLKDTANLSTGGTSTDVTDIVHPDNVFMAERIARLVNLDICGIDIVAKDIRQPIQADNGAVIEVNACPGLRMHLSPAKGLPRNVAEPIVEMLYPRGSESRIPLVAVTGTNGKTTTTRLTAHIAKTAGHTVGFTTTDGIYIDGKAICYGDCTGEQSTETVLTEPLVDFAVLECARGGIIRSGLGFDHCDISIITNVTADHLGLDDINTLEDMARVKKVVADSTFRDGYSILNAEDDLVYEMGDDLECNIALFALDPRNERVKRHCARGGLAAVIEKDQITICKGEWKIRICRIADVPLSFSGASECMIRNILPAVLVGIIRNFRIEDIRKALFSFVPSPEMTPGRMNIFSFRNFDVMIDYAHNPGGFAELKKFLDKMQRPKVGIITAPGDRRDEDIQQVGSLAAQIFDEIIIRHDEDLRGRTAENISELLLKGIRSIYPETPVRIVPREKDALRDAMIHAQPGAIIVTLTEAVREAIDFVSRAKAKEEAEMIEV